MNTLGKVTLGCVLAASLSWPATANPVNYKRDLEGRKICWTSPTAPAAAQGSSTTFYAGGKAYNTYWGQMTISGHHVDAERGSFESNLDKLPDGTFKVSDNIGGKVYESTGRYCQ